MRMLPLARQTSDIGTIPRYWQGLRSNTLGKAGLGLLAGLVIMALAAPIIAPYDPTARSGPSFSKPSWSHPLGTNDIGQDILSEWLHGARISLFVGIVAALAGTAIGISVALVAGFFGKVADIVLMRLVDVTLSLPFLPFIIVVGAFAGPSLMIQILLIAGIVWALTARVARAQVLTAKERTHVVAAKAMGASRLYIARRHILPMIFPIAISQFVKAASISILLEASLSFLGVGDPLSKSWGSMLFFASARGAFLTDSWIWWVIPPGLSIVVTVLAFALIGYHSEGKIHPRLQLRANNNNDDVIHTKTTGKNPDEYIIAKFARNNETPVLEIKGLTIEYAGSDSSNNNPAGKKATTAAAVVAVDRASLTICRGQICGVVGESGSGKTTLATAVMGLIKPPGRVVDGFVNINLGSDAFIATHNVDIKHLRGNKISFIPQNAMNALNPVFTIEDQLVEAITTHQKTVTKQDARSRAICLLQLVGIPRHRARSYPHELSGGMLQRVVIAMALANDPVLVVADEPTTGLDVVRQAEILKLLTTLRKDRNLAIMIISHDLRTILKVADHVVVMKGGSVLEQSSVDRLSSNTQHDYTRRLLNSVNMMRRANTDKKNSSLVSKEPLLELSHISKTFAARSKKGVKALDDVSFCVLKGEIVGLVGASGVGKSTISKIIMGLVKADGGSVIFEGKKIALGEAAQKMHLVFQDPYESLSPTMRVRDIVQEPLVICHNIGNGGGTQEERESLMAKALGDVSLVPVSWFSERYPHELSGGERQRVALARALILGPKMIVADEPTSMLDATLRLEMIKLIKKLRTQYGVACLYITHDIDLARACCDRLLVMHDGKIVEDGPPEELTTNPAHPYTALLVRSARFDDNDSDGDNTVFNAPNVAAAAGREDNNIVD